MDNSPHPVKKMAITTADEGATSHCVIYNRSLAGQVLFDRPDEFQKRKRISRRT